MGVKSLAAAVARAVQKRINEETRAMRGTIQGNRFISGAKSYPFTQAVDCDAGDGKKVWAQLSQSGKAVVVGA